MIVKGYFLTLVFILSFYLTTAINFVPICRIEKIRSAYDPKKNSFLLSDLDCLNSYFLSVGFLCSGKYLIQYLPELEFWM